MANERWSITDRRIVVDFPGDRFHGERGTIIETCPRTPTVRVRLDRIPPGCQSAEMWFGARQVRALRPSEVQR